MSKVLLILLAVSNGTYNEGNMHSMQVEMSSMDQCRSMQSHLKEIMSEEWNNISVNVIATCVEKEK